LLALLYFLADVTTAQPVGPADKMADTPPHALTGCYPYYPPIAIRTGMTGMTTLSFIVGPDGNPVNVTVDKSSGYTLLDDASVRCAQSSHFKPATKDGKPVAFLWHYAVRWNITDSPAKDAAVGAALSVFRTALSDCMRTPPLPSPDDLDRAESPTTLEVSISDGAITTVTTKSSSGNPALDARALACFTNLPHDATKNLPDADKASIPIAWKRPAPPPPPQ